ncbi:hypothetical protein [Trujillonella humicola]|uniref:hypothetical protein n=1 Tax=Trujillonella humicola TaxID=3383699 RepID=UPI0039057DA1
MSAAARAADVARRGLELELAMWRALLRWVLRRPRVPDGAEAFPSAGASTPVIWAFVVVSAIEVVVVHLLVPWDALRLVLDLAGVYGVLWMLGLLAALRTTPHWVDGTGLRVRHGFAAVDLHLPWADIAAVRVRRRSVEGSRTVRLHVGGPHRAVSVNQASATQVDLELRTPRVLSHRRAGSEPVTELRIAVDDPAALVRRLRAGMGAASAR